MTDERAAVDEMDEADGTLPAGFEFGAYIIGACVGQGGMARVYRAEHRALRKRVALKVMDGTLLQRPDWHHRFLREGQAAAAVKHPNVVDITDVGVLQGRPYLVMEFLEGEDLEQYLSRHKPLSEAELARLMIPVISGLATAHACGVVHRDLKPSNVFLSRGPEGEIVPKLLDFGVSKLTFLQQLDPSSTQPGELMGSPMYMSPEAVRGARDLTPQSDQYSLGVVLYECVTGRAPFQGDSLLAVLEAVAHGNFDPPRLHRPDLSYTLEEAILRAMAPQPQARFANVREVGRALCHSADHRTRLLWTPAFGLPDALEGKTTAVLGSTPLRTAAPLHLSVPVAAKGGSWRPWAALAVLGLGALAYFGRGRSEPAPAGEAPHPSAVRALLPPAEAASPSLPIGPAAPAAEALAGASTDTAPAKEGAANAAASNEAASNEAMPKPAGSRSGPAVAPGADRPALPAARRRMAVPRHEPSPTPAARVVPAEPAGRFVVPDATERPARAERAFGPNRSPILD